MGTAPDRPREISTAGLYAAVLLLAIAVTGCAVSVPVANAPPTGSIWFGSSFDPQTFAVTGKAESFTSGTPVAFVAHLPHILNGAVTVRVSVNEATMVDQPVNTTGSGEFFGTTFSGLGLFGPGSYRFEVVDVGGNVLASGSVSVI